MTRLEAFRIAHDIRPAELERESRVSRQFLLRVRRGEADPTRTKMLMIRDACSRLLRRRVHLAELFDLGEAAVIVSREDGDAFAREWFRQSWDTGALLDAFGMTKVMPWPDHDEEGQARYQDIEDEVCERVCDAVREAISEAFVKAANEVLARERSGG